MQINGSSINASAINGSSRVRKILFDGEVNVDFISNSTLIKFSNFEASSDSELHSFGETYKKAHINSNAEISILNQFDPIKKVFSNANFIACNHTTASSTLFKFGDGLAVASFSLSLINNTYGLNGICVVEPSYSDLSLIKTVDGLNGICVVEPSYSDLSLIKTIRVESELTLEFDLSLNTTSALKKVIDGKFELTLESNFSPMKFISSLSGEAIIAPYSNLNILRKKVIDGKFELTLDSYISPIKYISNLNGETIISNEVSASPTLFKFGDGLAITANHYSFGETYKKAHINSNVEINILNQFDPIKKVFSTAEFIAYNYTTASPTLFKFGDGLAVASFSLSLINNTYGLTGICVVEPSYSDLKVFKTIRAESTFENNLLLDGGYLIEKNIEGDSKLTLDSYISPIKYISNLNGETIISNEVSASPTIFKFGDGLAITANHLSLSISLNGLSGISVCEPSVCDLDLIKTINFEASFGYNILTDCEFRRKKRIEGNSSYTFESNLIPTKSITAFGDCYIEVVSDFKALFKKILVGQSDCQLTAKLSLNKKTTLESLLILAISSELKSILNINSEDIESQKLYKIHIQRYSHKDIIIRNFNKQIIKVFCK